VNLIGTVNSAASLVLSRTTLPFGQLRTGVLSTKAMTFTVTNTGEASSAVVLVPPAGGAVQATGCAAALAYLASCDVTVNVQPTATGSVSGNLAVTGATNSPVAVSWFGTLAAQITAQTPTHAFGNAAVLSSTSNEATFTFANGETAEVTGPLTVAVDNADFVVTGGTCLDNAAVGIATGDSCTVTVQFTPTALTPAAKTANLTVSATPGTAAGTPAKSTMTGTAVSAISVTSVTGAATVIDSGSTTFADTVAANAVSEAAVVLFTNEAGAPTTGRLAAKLSGTGSAQFRVINDQCTGKQLAGGGTCTVEIVFAPTAAGANKTATITVSGTPGNSAALALVATAT
jgi:hypothetical protein